MQDKPITLEMLGGFHLRVNGDPPIELPRQLVGALLAYLAVHSGRQHTREELAEVLWPDSGDEARQRLRQTLYALKKTLSVYGDDIVLVSKAGAQINREIVRTDVGILRHALRQAIQTKDLSERLRLLTLAADTYRGPLLPGFYQDWVTQEQEALASIHRESLRALAEGYQKCGNLSKAVETANRLIALDPLAEEAYCLAMKLHAAEGRPNDVLKTYRELEKVLADELGETPAHETTKLMESLRSQSRAVASRVPQPAAVSAEAVASRPVSSPVSWPELPVLPSEPVAAARPVRQRVGKWMAAATLCVAVALVAWGGMGWFAHSPEGKLAWQWVHPGRSGDKDMEVTGLVADRHGNIHVTGFVQTAATDVDMITVKLSPDGRQLWEKPYDSSLNDCDRAQSIAVDAEGNVYVTGNSYTGELKDGKPGWEFVTLKYDRQGNRVWVRAWGNPEWKGDDFPVRVVCNESGEVFVTGTSYDREKEDPRRKSAITTIKYSPDGTLLWASVRSSADRADSYACDMTLAADGTPVVIGASRGWNEENLCLLAFGQNGSAREGRYVARARGEVRPLRVRSAPSGELFVTGYTFNGEPAIGGTGQDAFIVKFDRNLEVAWDQMLATPFQSQFNDVALDDRGVAHVGGVHADEFHLTAIGRDGKKLGEKQLKGPSGHDSCAALVSLPDGGYAAAGHVSTRMASTGELGADTVVLRFNPDGRQRWYARWDSPKVGKGDVATHLTTDRRGSIIAAGVTDDGAHKRLLVLKYAR